MLRHIFALGVQPQALLLPKRPDRGKCNLCQPDRLQVLIDVLRERDGKDLSPTQGGDEALPCTPSWVSLNF